MHARLSASLALALLILIGGCSTAPTPAPRQPRTYSGDWSEYVYEAADRFDVPSEWIWAVIQVESGGQTHFADGRQVVSHAGAMGLMQLMPQTWEEMRDRHGLGDDPFDPRNNIMAGTAYIREMYDMFGSPGFLGAYNAGPTRYGQHAYQGRRLPLETRRYMAIIGPQIAGIHPRSESRSVAANTPRSESPRSEPPQEAAPPRVQPVSTGNRVVMASSNPALARPTAAAPAPAGRPAPIRSVPAQDPSDLAPIPASYSDSGLETLIIQSGPPAEPAMEAEPAVLASPRTPYPARSASPTLDQWRNPDLEPRS